MLSPLFQPLNRPFDQIDFNSLVLCGYFSLCGSGLEDRPAYRFIICVWSACAALFFDKYLIFWPVSCLKHFQTQEFCQQNSVPIFKSMMARSFCQKYFKSQWSLRCLGRHNHQCTQNRVWFSLGPKKDLWIKQHVDGGISVCQSQAKPHSDTWFALYF